MSGRPELAAAQPAGRWFRFSLRTMFLATTVICGWLGWELSALRERREVRREFQERAAYQFFTADSFDKNWPTPQAPEPAVSWLRRLLGDEPVYTIWVPPDVAEGAPELATLRRVFPEAEQRQWQHEPCHPGCFPAETLVETPDGPKRIDTIRPDDLVLTVDKLGRATVASVESVFVTDNELLRIELESGPLVTTETQPLCGRDGEVRPAGKLAPGDEVLRWHEGALCSEKVIRVDMVRRTEAVFNLILGDSQLFVAGGILARSKPPKDR